MTTRLQLYNDALLACKERFLSSLDENVKARRLLDQAWNSSGVRYCLEQGQWQFAMRTQRIDPDPDVTTQFGYAYAFDKPTDWVLTSALCSDERFDVPLHQYTDETDYWFADITPIYVKYVSDDDQYGNNLARWPATFADYVSMYLASKVVIDLTGSKDLAAAIMQPRKGLLDQALLKAKNRAMMTQPAQFAATGSWVRSRRGSTRRGPMGDGGSSGALTG